MSIGRHTVALPLGARGPCRRCKDSQATVWIRAWRLSRSGNYRLYTAGAYCRVCARAIITARRTADGKRSTSR